MGYSISQLRQLKTALQAAPSLLKTKVFLGARFMNRNGGAINGGRVVIVPKGGPVVGRAIRATNNVGGVTVAGQGSIRDIRRVVAVHLWAKGGQDTDENFDALEDLENRFFQALEYQAIGGLPSSSSVTPGAYWEAVEEEFDASEDSAKEGEELWLALELRTSTAPATTKTGSADSSQLSSLTTTLAAAMLATDTIATLTNAAGFPANGVMSIDAELIQFQAIQGNQAVLLVRGVNNTTPATHAQGATVSVF